MLLTGMEKLLLLSVTPTKECPVCAEGHTSAGPAVPATHTHTHTVNKQTVSVCVGDRVRRGQGYLWKAACGSQWGGPRSRDVPSDPRTETQTHQKYVDGSLTRL